MATSNLGVFIRQTRKKRGVSLTEFSRQIEIAAPSLSEIERGKRNPSDAVLERIARALGIECQELQALDSWTALKDFRDIIENDANLSLAFTTMVRALKSGKITEKTVAERLRKIATIQATESPAIN